MSQRHDLEAFSSLLGEVGITDLRSVLEALLDRSMQILSVQKGFVVLARDGHLLPIVIRHGTAGSPDDDSFSRTVCQRAMEAGEPLLLAGSDDWVRFGAVESLRADQVRTIIAIPLPDAGRVLGVIYLEGRTLESAVRGEKSFLAQLAKVGGQLLTAALECHQIVQDRERWRWLASQSEAPDMERTGQSPAMARALAVIRKVAPEDVTVLILGESGSGKEVAARKIHELSPRRTGPFIAINCGAIPRDLMEAELFGYEKGAFSGASARVAGRLELSQGGTLLLDEIGDLPRELQVKLLRALETRSFERIGGRETIHWDGRLLAATHRDLETAVAQGEFRADLYYRINVVSFHLPALRERIADLPGLVHEMLATYNRRFSRKLFGVTPAALAALESYSWPGNVRELRNVMERAFILESSDRITPESLPFAAPVVAPNPVVRESPATVYPVVVPLETFLANQERDYLRLVLDQFAGNVTKAATALELTRGTLHRKMRLLGIRRVQGPGADPDEGE